MTTASPASHGAPSRREGEGPHDRLILRDVTVIDGTGSPPYGPADIVIEGNRIALIHLVADPLAAMQPAERPEAGPTGRVVDLPGHYVLPGLVDLHGHIGGPAKVPSAQYVYDLWLGHGVTTIRDPGSTGNGTEFTVHETKRAEASEITAPRMVPYTVFGEGRDAPFVDGDEARRWVADIVERGAAGVKFFGQRADILRAALQETTRLGLGSACHHTQRYVAQADALQTARWGLGSIEHWYGLPEALFTDRRVQHYSSGHDYGDEEMRFGEAGTVWRQAAEPGSDRWNAVADELVSLGTALDPTFNVYIGMRDAERVRTSEWHEQYTSRRLWTFWQPSPHRHGSCFYDWTTEQEINWRHNYQRWMAFVKTYYDRGGRVTMGTDAGSIYKLYGFANVEELELLREAGLHPLEVINAATLAGAQQLGIDADTGSVEPGKRADLIVLSENPLANLKVMYGHGGLLRNGDGTLERAGGITYTLRDGILYHAPSLLDRVREVVQAEAVSGTPKDAGAPVR